MLVIKCKLHLLLIPKLPLWYSAHWRQATRWHFCDAGYVKCSAAFCSKWQPHHASFREKPGSNITDFQPYLMAAHSLWLTPDASGNNVYYSPTIPYEGPYTQRLWICHNNLGGEEFRGGAGTVPNLHLDQVTFLYTRKGLYRKSKQTLMAKFKKKITDSYAKIFVKFGIDFSTSSSCLYSTVPK